MKKQPMAFMSYVRQDDQHETGRLTQFCERLGGEVQMQTGEEFHIFQDRNDIAWGQQWKQRIEESLDATSFLIPIITPSFFNSPPCRAEFERFLEREKKLKRGDLILPVYYVECPIVNNESKRASDPMAKVVATRQYADWRSLRFEPFTSPEVGKTLAGIVKQLVEALERGSVLSSRESRKKATPANSRKTAKNSRLVRPQPAKASRIEIEAGPGPERRNEPPTHIVDALHRGDYATINEALNAANPGDRILIRPGLYEEGLIIEKPVELLGDGELGEVVIQSNKKDVILFRANMGRIANLTLRQLSEGAAYCVDICQGRLELEGCDITSQSFACVAIRNGSDPRLRRNYIHHGAKGGIFIYDNGLGTLEDNDIFANTNSGVAIKLGGNPTVRRNRIHDGKSGGVFVYESGLGTLEDNDIFANAKAGVTVIEGGNPMVRRNRINHNKHEAIWVSDGGQGVFEDNDLRENERGAWDIEANCVSKVKRVRNQE